ncbi:MAG: aldo/keto reductase [Bacilli bacterium]|nr:aldo/keto reductase [Bacilli bacterium]
MNKENIFPLAIGTYGLGASRSESWEENDNELIIDEEEMKALIYSYEQGQNFIETSYIYAGGQTMRFISEFLKRVDRTKLFVTVKIENYIEKVEDIEEQLDKYLNILGIDYADSILLHTPKVSKIPLEESYKELKRLVSIGKSRYVSASNLNIDQLKMIVEELGIKLFSFEGLYNLECKQNEDVGILDYCKEHNILFINYQPFRRNRTANHNYPLLVELANKYNKTQNQILLNYYVKEKNIVPITKANKMEHIKLNIEALGFDMEQQDYQRLNDFRCEEFDKLEVDWEDEGGIPIYKFANQVE